MSGSRSLTPFYIVLATVAVAGGVFIALQLGKGPQRLALSTVGMPPVAGERGVVMGSDSAPVEVLEFSDFECPYCARFAVLTLPDVKNRMVASGQVRLRFVHFPLDIHAQGPHAHLAAACANEQGRFWAMHDLLFENQDEWVRSRRPDRVAEGYAERLGLDMGRFRSCVREQRGWSQVLADRALGESLRVGGTPTVFVNGRQLSEPPSFDQLRRIVDSLAQVAPAAPAPARR